VVKSTQALAPIAVVLSLCACSGSRVGLLGSRDAGLAARPIDASTTITLERGNCYGLCPVYSLSITGDGKVSYVGNMFVKVRGAATGQVAVEAVQQLVDTMVAASYFSMAVPADCPDIETDAPTVTTSLTLAGQSHTVEDYHGNGCAPPVLRALEDQIDLVAQSSQWLGCVPGDYECYRQ
jgi:hypothetical protein